MNKLFFIFLFILSFSMKGQYLKQSNLIGYKKEIINFLVENNGVSGSENEEELLNMIYVIPINESNKCLSVYRMGTTTSHSIKYLLILRDGKLQPLIPNDTNIVNLKKELSNCGVKKRKVSKVIKITKEIIDYNLDVINKRPH